jgi:phosphodiester glycosidase
MRSRWYVLPAAAAVLVGVVAPAATASARGTAREVIAPGVTYERVERDTSHGTAVVHLLTVDLRQEGVALDLLHPDVVAARETISDQADGQAAVAGVNGDFFNITKEHDEAPATNAAVGPEIAGGKDLKAAVPNGQRFGPGLVDGTTTQDVFGVGVDGDARVGSLALDGVVHTGAADLDLVGLNQYAIAVNGIGAFTADWGTVSRMRSVCGTDTDRQAPCSDQTAEVTITNGQVAAVDDQPGSGAIGADSVVLVGREDGAKQLDQLAVGDAVTVEYRLDHGADPAYSFAVGGAPILRDGAVMSGVDSSTLAPRTGAGASLDGDHVYLVAVDGRSSASVGMTLAEMADYLAELGADDGVNLDGGGSTTLVARESGADTVTVRNKPSDGSQRAVANGIGVLAG